MMSALDLLLVQHALRDVEKALDHLRNSSATFDMDVFKAKLDLITAAGDLRAALVGNAPSWRSHDEPRDGHHAAGAA